MASARSNSVMASSSFPCDPRAIPRLLCASAKPGAIRITDVETSHTYVDEGAHGRGPGDVDIYRFVLFNKRIQALLDTDQKLAKQLGATLHL